MRETPTDDGVSRGRLSAIAEAQSLNQGLLIERLLVRVAKRTYPALHRRWEETVLAMTVSPSSFSSAVGGLPRVIFPGALLHAR